MQTLPFPPKTTWWLDGVEPPSYTDASGALYYPLFATINQIKGQHVVRIDAAGARALALPVVATARGITTLDTDGVLYLTAWHTPPSEKERLVRFAVPEWKPVTIDAVVRKILAVVALEIRGNVAASGASELNRALYQGITGYARQQHDPLVAEVVAKVGEVYKLSPVEA